MFKLNQTVYDRRNGFGKGLVTTINPDTQELTVLFDYFTEQYTSDGRHITKDIALQTKKQAFPFKVGDRVKDNIRGFGKGTVIELDPSLIVTALEVIFDESNQVVYYTSDGRFNIKDDPSLILIEPQPTFEVGDYVVDQDRIERGVGRVTAHLSNYNEPPVLNIEFNGDDFCYIQTANLVLIKR